jgi:hypothetical protein
LLVIVVLLLLKVHEVDEEEGAEEGRLHLDIKVEWEADAKVIGISEGFSAKDGNRWDRLDWLPGQSAPLLGNQADLLAVHRDHLEVNVAAAAAGAQRALDLEDRGAGLVLYEEPGIGGRE